MILNMIISPMANHVTTGAYVSNSSFRRLAFRHVGSTWPCVTSLCSLWGRICIVGTILKGQFGYPQELCFASEASNCWSPRVCWLPWWPLVKIPLHQAVLVLVEDTRNCDELPESSQRAPRAPRARRCSITMKMINGENLGTFQFGWSRWRQQIRVLVASTIFCLV